LINTFAQRRTRLAGFILSTSLLAACGGGGGGSDAAPVAPIVPPAEPVSTSISAQPQSQAITLNSVASFSVSTSGPVPLGYQWLRNGTPIDGATAASYTPPSARPLDNGAVFRVIVRTGQGQLESAPASLTVPGTGMRMVAGGLEMERTFDPIFDARQDKSAIATDAAGNVFTVKGVDLSKFTPDGVGEYLGKETCDPVRGIAVDKTGQMYIACVSSIIKRSANGVPTVFAGSRVSAGNIDGAAAVARFNTIAAITIGLDGLLYVADSGNGTIRRIAADGAVTTLAGAARNGTAVDGTGAAARFTEMRGLVADGQGNVYVTEPSAVRKVSAAGVVTTLAGDASATAPGWSDGAGPAARFGNLFGIAIDAAGQMYVADAYYHTIRKLSPSGVVSTLAGSHEQFGSSNGFGRFASFNMPRWLAVGANGVVVVVDYGNGTLRKVTPAGAVTNMNGNPGLQRSSGGLDGFGQEARLRTPKGLAIDGSGNLLVADSLGHTVRKITPAGEVSTLAGSVLRYGTTDGSGAQASFRFPTRVASAGNGVVYVQDTLGDLTTDMIRRIGSDGAVTTVTVPRDPLSMTATGAQATEYNRFVTADMDGNYYVVTYAIGATYCPVGQTGPACEGLGGRMTLRKISPTGASVAILSGNTVYPGTTVTIDSTGTDFKNMAVDKNGVVYIADITNKTVLKIATSGAISVLAGKFKQSDTVDGPGDQARFTFPEAISVDTAGNVYVVDSSNAIVRKISPAGVVSTLAGTVSSYEDPTGVLPGTLRPVTGIAVGGSGTVYITQENAIVKIVQPAQ
jgi:sugar lactone lactonase YvrE